MIGRQLSHYRIVERLGAGGMGTVYRAEDTRLGRSVALKFPHADLVGDADSRARFLAEARAASALDHPNIVVLYDVCDTEGELFLAMQHVEGRSLRKRLAEGSLPAAEVIRLGRGVADALAHAHGRRIIHRDIKPDNILLCADGRIKLADFGTARMANDAHLTMTGSWVGTPGYLAPEVIEGGPADARSDLFALGAVLFEACSGRAPFAAERPEQVLHRVLHTDPPPLPQSVPHGLRAVIRSLLARSPADRPPDAVAVADALADALADVAQVGDPETRAGDGTASSVLRSLAVLQFRNLTGNAEDDYFCAGMTEELLTDVLRIPDLKVTSRAATGSTHEDPQDARRIGRELGVATVLEGGVRRAGGRVRVTARLVRADSGYQLWSERYDRDLEDLFEVQEDISRNIAGALRVVFAPDTEDSRQGRRTRSPRAYDLRLRARELARKVEEPAMRQAVALLEEALSEDEGYAVAHADLADSFVQFYCKSWDIDTAWLARAEDRVKRSLELAPRLPEAFRARGHIWMHRSRPDLALQDFQQAVDLDPGFAGAQNNLAVVYLVLGDPGRAEVHARRARELDPNAIQAHLNLGSALQKQGRFAEAHEVLRAAASVQSPAVYEVDALELLLRGFCWQGDSAGAQAIAREIQSHAGAPASKARFALAAAVLGDGAEARRLLAEVEREPKPRSVELIAAARAWVLLGEREAAIAALERRFAVDVADLAEVRGDPDLEPLLLDARFAKLQPILRGMPVAKG